MGVVYLAYCGSWQLSLHVPCFCAFYIFNTTPNPTSSSFFSKCFCTCYKIVSHEAHSYYDRETEEVGHTSLLVIYVNSIAAIQTVL